MEDIFVTKIIEAEKQADEIVSKSQKKANKMLENYKLEYSSEKKQIEQKYDEMIYENQETIKKECDADFNEKAKQMKTEVEKIKLNLDSAYDVALNILLSGVSDNGNS